MFCMVLAVVVIIGLVLSYYCDDITSLWEEAEDYEHDMDEDTNLISKGE